MAMDGAAPTPVRIHVSLWQLMAAVATCAVIFVAGFAVGRMTADTNSTMGNLSAAGSIAGPSSADDEATTADDNGAGSGASSDSSGEAAGETTESGGVTVEALEAALATIDHQRITFVPRTPELTDDAVAAVAEISTVLVAHPFIPVEVEIRTDTEATPGENHGLSVLQAESVTAALAAAGVEPSRLTAVGLGGSQEPPNVDQLVRFASNDSATDRLLGAVDFVGITFDESGNVTGGDETLAAVVEAMAINPAAMLDIVGYAYIGDADDTNHDRSHTITDAVAGRLVAAGLDAARIDTIGLGQVPTKIDGETHVEFEVGQPAALTLALRQIDEARIQFEDGTDQLTADGAAAVIEVANALQLDPSQRVEISTHTYSAATSSANHQLSHLQGEAVVEALVASGVAADRLELRAHGNPIAFREANRAGYVSFYPLD